MVSGVPTLCGLHKQSQHRCPDCRFQAERISVQEKQSVELMEKSIQKLPNGKLKISYPFNERAELQRSNANQARAVQTRVEKTLKAKGVEDEYHREMEKALEAGSIVPVSEGEMAAWKGPVHYVTLFPVINLESTSTKLRIVSNSKMPNAVTGFSFNDTTQSVPNALNDIFSVLVQWRGHPTCIMYSISKAYQSIKTGEVEKHLRRLVYRRDPRTPSRTYAYDSVTFGDDPAACALELCKVWTALDSEDIDHQAAQQLVKSGFVDDIGGGGTQEEVARMKGVRDESGNYSGTIPKVLARGGFIAKSLVEGGNCTQEEADSLGGKFLGIPYDPITDTILMSVKTTIRAKHQRQQRGKATQTVDWDDDFAEEILTGDRELTRRKVLALVMSQYDPLGLLAPLLVRAKVLLRSLYGKGEELKWDTPLAKDQAEKWARLIKEANHMPVIPFKRQLQPENVDPPLLIAFWDGSLTAYGACVYVRWGPEEGEGDVRLVTAKSRVAPLSGVTAQRMELQGLVLCLRLTRKVLEAFPCVVKEAIVSGDSMCCLMSVRKDGISFNPYFQNRLGQVIEEIETIQQHVEIMGPLQKVPGPDNPADMCTREYSTPEDLMPGSVWQAGPLFLRGPRSDWPLTTPTEDGHIPVQELRGSAKHLVSAASNVKPLELVLRELCERKGSLDVVIGATARLLKSLLSGKRSDILHHPTDLERAAAERLLQWAFSGEVKEAETAGRLKGLLPFNKGGVWYTTGRYSVDRLLELTGKVSLPIVLAASRLGMLYVTRAHREDHKREPANVLARTRRSVWLVGGRTVAAKAVQKCTYCRLQRRVTAEQLMGKLPPQVLEPSSPFNAVCLDLFGPLLARGIGGHTRKEFKTWGVVFCCLSSKAVAMWLAPSYSCKSFMLCFKKQAAIYGKPAAVVSDRGSQLMAAGRELKEWEEMTQEIKKAGTVWKFVPTACAWRVGQAERAVALAKHTLQHLVNKHVTLDFVELESTLMHVAELINQRPLAVRQYNDLEYHPVSPSDLLLGRIYGYRPGIAQTEPPAESSMELGKSLERVEELVTLWWERWTDAAFPLFCPRTKWVKEKRNMVAGDIVLLKNERKLGKGEYRLGKVMSVLPDPDGVVRTVMLGLRKRRGQAKEGRLECKQGLEVIPMAVQRLVVLQAAEET